MPSDKLAADVTRWKESCRPVFTTQDQKHANVLVKASLLA